MERRQPGSRRQAFLAFLIAQLAAQAAVVLAWWRVPALQVLGTETFPFALGVLLAGILGFGLFLLMKRKAGFLSLLGQDQLSLPLVLLFVLSFLFIVFVGAGEQELLRLAGRIGLVSRIPALLLAAAGLLVPFLILDANLLLGGAAVSGLDRLAAPLPARLHLPRRAGLLALGISLAFFGLFLLLFRPGYVTNDDAFMVSLLTGYPGGTPQPFSEFSNVLLGLLLVPLYRMGGDLNWEVLYFLLVNFLSVWALLSIPLSRRLPGWLRLLGILGTLAGEAYFLVNLTFTTIAASASLAGCCLLLDALLERPRTAWARAAGGLGLVLAGSLIRFDALLLVAAVLLPGLLAHLWASRPAFRTVRRLILAALAAALLVLGGLAVDRLALQAHPDWQAFDSYSQARSQLHDTPRLQNMASSVDEVGWSENDYFSFRHWFFPDPETYSLARLQILAARTPITGADVLDGVAFYAGRLFSLVALPYDFLLLACGLALLLRGFPLRRAVLPALLPVLAAAAVGCLLAVTMKSPNRVLLPPLWAAFQVGFLLVFCSGLENGRRAGAGEPLALPWGRVSLLLAGCLAAVLALAQTAISSHTHREHQAVYRQILADLQALRSGGILPEQALIVSPAYGVPVEWSDPLVVEFPSIDYLNMGWMTFSPPYQAVLADRGIGSLPTALVTKPGLYLMTTPKIYEDVRLFLLEHEGLSVRAEVLYELPEGALGTAYEGARLYRFRSGE